MTITLYEKYNRKRLMEVLTCNNIPIKAGDEVSYIEESAKMRNMLFGYSKRKLVSKGVRVTYTQNAGRGRHFANGFSLQSMPKGIRKYIIWNDAGDIPKPLYHDVDMVGAHPNILYQVFAKCNVNAGSQLGKYISDREALFKEIGIPVDDGKKMFLSMIYDSEMKFEVLKPTHSLIYKDLIKVLKKENMPLFNRLKQDKGNKKNIDGCFLSHYIGAIENTMLESMCKFFSDKGFVPGVLAFDGCMIEWNDSMNDEVLRECEVFVKRSTTYDITLAFKKTEPDFVPTFDEESLEGLDNALKEDDLFASYRDIWEQGSDDRHAAMICVGMLKDDVKYISKSKSFYVFSDKTNLWFEAEKCIVKNRMGFVLETFYKHLNDWHRRNPPDDGCESYDGDSYLDKIGMDSVMSAIFRAGYEFFKDDTFEAKLDTIPWLFSVRNGVIDLRTGDLRERTRDDYLSRSANIDYIGLDGDTGLWDKFFFDIMSEDLSKVEFMQRLSGYGITGFVCEQLFFIFTGVGGNGKGLFMKCLKALIGRFYCEMNSQVLIVDYNGNRDAEVCKMDKARVSVFNELQEGEAKLMTDVVKRFSGGDAIPCRNLYERAGDLIPYFTPILTTNNMPTVEGDRAMMRRLVQVEFATLFIEGLSDDRVSPTRKLLDLELEEKLLNNLEGLLVWLVQGAVRWFHAKDLKTNQPECVSRFTKEYFYECDMLQQFIDNECEIGDDFRVSSKALTEAFKASSGEHVSPQLMKVRMLSKGFKKHERLKIDGVNQRGYIGLKVKPYDPYRVSEL